MVVKLALAIPAVLVAALVAARAPSDERAKAAAGRDHPAFNAPDQFAWELFIKINQPAGGLDVLWETWAEDIDTFPRVPDAAKPPAWPGGKKQPKELTPSRQLELLRLQDEPPPKGGQFVPQIAATGGQEVRRNRAAFDFIVGQKLWHRDGIAAAVKAGKPVDFPTDAIEIKAEWKLIAEADKPRFHWNTDVAGKVHGLIALHVSTKDVPGWFWATFEHAENPNRGKELGTHDAFGVEPPDATDGKVSAALEKMFKAAKMAATWRNYRLLGTQTAFTDTTGRPVHLGNSEIEGRFMKTSSCMTCHAKAAADATGAFLPVFRSRNPLEGDIGTPKPEWYFNADGTRKTLQMDFVWAFTAARPLPPPPPVKK